MLRLSLSHRWSILCPAHSPLLAPPLLRRRSQWTGRVLPPGPSVSRINRLTAISLSSVGKINLKRMVPTSYRLATIGSGVCGAAPPSITLPRLGRLSAPFSSSDYGKCSSSIPAVSWPLRLTCDPNKVNYSVNPYQTLRPNYTIHNQNLWKRPPQAARRTTGRKPKRPLPKVLVTEPTSDI